MAFYNNITVRFALKEARIQIDRIKKDPKTSFENDRAFPVTWRLDNGKTLKVWITNDRRWIPDTPIRPGYWITTHRLAYQHEEPKARVYYEAI